MEAFLVKYFQHIFLSLTFLTALGALMSAGGAFLSARATKKTSLGQILMEIADAYASPEMLEGMLTLRQFKDISDRSGDDFAQEFVSLRTINYQLIEEVDQGRRRYSHHFHKIRQLLDSKLVKKNFVRKVVTQEQVNFLVEVIEPLERAINPQYDHRTFDIFRNLYDC
jgi:hypothetical protein